MSEDRVSIEENEPVIEAITNGNLPEVKHFVADGIHPNQPVAEDDQSMVHVAAKLGQKSILEYLIANGGDLKHDDCYG